MLEVLTVTVLKAMASTCVKLYVASLLGSGAIVHKRRDLGYKVPRWYENHGRRTVYFHSFGTSIEGDEFESLEHAREKATRQMVKHIRLSNQKLVAEHVRYDKESVKQSRFVELFIRGSGLEAFVQTNARISERQLVKVSEPERDMRAFVRLSLHSKYYLEYQQKEVQTLKRKLMRQKAEDILAEIDAEKAGKGGLEGIGDDLSEKAGGGPGVSSSADDAFRELDKEAGGQ
jgi:hypothetical protein